MAKKKTDDVQETAENKEAAVEETAAETTESAAGAGTPEAAEAVEPADGDETAEATVEVNAAEPEAEENKAKKAKADAEPAKKKAAKPVAAAPEAVAEPTEKVRGKRNEKVGFVASDKMTNTVTVRVDRLVKHPTYRKYVRRRKKFMAHDDLGSKIGDKVRIVETRPMSARKRWRVVEILQKADR